MAAETSSPILPGVRKVVLAMLAALLLAPAAQASGAAATPRLTAQDRREIGVLVDRFVKDAVRRESLPAAWKLLGPGLSSSTTRAAWDAGSGVTVDYYPVRGDDFTTAWTAVPVENDDAILSMMFHPDARHPHVPQTAFNAEVKKLHGRWVVNGFYPAAQFYGGGHVVGPADFGAIGGSATNHAKARISPRWFAAAVAVLGAIVVAVPLGIWLRARRRDRRAYAAYLSSRP